MDILCKCGHSINEHTAGCMWSHYTVDESANSPLVCRCNLTPQDIAADIAARLAAAEAALERAEVHIEAHEFHTGKDRRLETPACADCGAIPHRREHFEGCATAALLADIAAALAARATEER